ncbi:MAG: UDP-N-acetylglucosamine 4,6-dehydratase (inverting) [Bdellovibrionales bacterium]|nr:UDP-N-acetylglucosamine 4,6-dehydratase (inverting) [Bdellovibrionales bacterium]
MLNDATILITGGTGSFGKKFVEMTLAKYKPKKIIIYSRDEMKQWEMMNAYGGDERLRFFQGDIRDKSRLKRACEGVDVLIHAAALKIVPTAEYNPFETIKTNVLGAMNVIDAAIDGGIKRVVALSTDKACNPINLYGATKLCSDKLFVAGNSYVGTQDTRFSVVRYGNVMGSRGSVLPFFYSMKDKDELPITDAAMTRFMITLEQGVELVWTALEEALGGEIFVKKIPSMRVVDIAKTIAPNAKLKFVGIRPGEKIHEQMISQEDARNAREYDGYFKIFPHLDPNYLSKTHFEQRKAELGRGRPLPEGFSYSSDSNTEWMDPQNLADWIEAEIGPLERTSASLSTRIEILSESSEGDSSEVPFASKSESLEKVTSRAKS